MSVHISEEEIAYLKENQVTMYKVEFVDCDEKISTGGAVKGHHCHYNHYHYYHYRHYYRHYYIIVVNITIIITIIIIIIIRSHPRKMFKRFGEFKVGMGKV